VSQVKSMLYPLIHFYDALGGRFADLSRPQLRLMMKLTGDPPTISELAESLNISSPGVTQMIDKLQSKGYVERQSQEKDQRLVRVKVTQGGRGALNLALASFEERVEEVLRPLSQEEKDQLLALFLKIEKRMSDSSER